MIRTIYLNLEDDIAKIAARLKRENVDEIVLVFPKKSFIFSDSINLRLLKKQVDLLGKTVHILTMDEAGQRFATEAGFSLKFLSKSSPGRGFGDIRSARPAPTQAPESEPAPAPKAAPVVQASAPSAISAVAAAAAIAAAAAEALVHRKPARAPAPGAEEKAAGWDNLFSPIDSAGASVPAQPRRLRETPFAAAPRALSGIASVFHRRAILGFVALSLVVILMLVFVVLPSADITVYAKTQPVARDIEISLSTQAPEADSTRLIMPATPVNQQFDQANKFNSAGKQEVGSKAEGKVYIINLTGGTLNLKLSTTTLTLGGKKYLFNQDQTGIKTNSAKGGDPTKDPNIRIADIIAAQGGPDYNLPAGTRMEIANQVFGSRPQVLYAKTVSAITGGNSRFVSQITDDDIKTSQAALSQAAVDALRNDLKQKNLILPDKAFTLDNAQFTTDKPTGTQSPTFQGEAKGAISGLALDYTVLVQMIRERISRTLSGNEQLQDVSLDKASYLVKSLDLAGGSMGVSVHYESEAISDIDTSDIINRISGKTKQQASEIILSKPEIDRVDIALAPSWQNTIPRFRQKIRLEVKK